MKTVGMVIGVLLVLLGMLWFFQGINVLPGSFMSGQTRWAIYGALCGIAGIAVIVVSRRSIQRPPGR